MDRQGLCELLDAAEVEYREAGENLVVVLPGEKRLTTDCLFIPQQSMFRIEAFVCRHVEEAHAEVYAMLLQENRKTFGVHYTLDHNKDIYLVGQFSDSTTPEDIQKILGQVLQRADQDFNRILERGFATSISHEWAWRLSRGESTANLQAFSHLRPSDEEVARLAPLPDSPAAAEPGERYEKTGESCAEPDAR